jgi:hypothetical protein
MNLEQLAYPAVRPALFPQLRVVDGKIKYVVAPTPPSEMSERRRLHLKRTYNQARAIAKARRARGVADSYERAEMLPLEAKQLAKLRPNQKLDADSGSPSGRFVKPG